MRPEEFIDQRSLRPYGITPRAAERWRKDGGGPAYVRLGKRRILYRVSDVERWLAERTFVSRADELSRLVVAPPPELAISCQAVAYNIGPDNTSDGESATRPPAPPRAGNTKRKIKPDKIRDIFHKKIDLVDEGGGHSDGEHQALRRGKPV